MARKFLALCAIVVPLTMVACGGDDSTSTSASSDTSSTAATTESSTTASGGGGGGGETIDISETEYKLDPSDPTAKAGSVTFNVSNDGSTTHNLEIEGNGVEEVTDDLAPGDSGEVTADLQPGDYEIYCAIDGHRDLGMEGSVTVQ